MLTSATRCAILLLVTSTILLIVQTVSADTPNNVQERPLLSKPQNGILMSNVRQRRAIRKPGFFWTLGSSIFQQFNETRSAFRQIRKLVNDQFIDESTPAPPKVPKVEVNATTTEAPYRISRKEFNQIIMRNLRGLSRLYNLELDAALKQSTYNQNEFNKQLRYSVKEQLS